MFSGYKNKINTHTNTIELGNDEILG